jgi:hypothetical protein
MYHLAHFPISSASLYPAKATSGFVVGMIPVFWRAGLQAGALRQMVPNEHKEQCGDNCRKKAATTPEQGAQKRTPYSEMGVAKFAARQCSSNSENTT